MVDSNNEVENTQIDEKNYTKTKILQIMIIDIRINFINTKKDHLFLAALISEADEYEVSLGEAVQPISIKGKKEFEIDLNKTGNVLPFKVRSITGLNENKKVKINVFKKGEGDAAKIVVTIDNSYRITTMDGDYIILNEKSEPNRMLQA